MGILDRLFGKGAKPAAGPVAPGMVRVVCTTTFLHGTDRFEEGDTRTVSVADAAYFAAQGWAQTETTLAVQDGVITSEARHG